MRSVLLSLLCTLPLVGLSGCYNRPPIQTRSLPATAYGVKAGQPSLIAFSALWCHPCREEIESLNQANEEFSGQIQVMGFLLEGEEKGSPVTDADVSKFNSFNGVKPEYPIRLDENWTLFDRSHAPQGRSLPTLLVIDRDGRTQEIVQQSLDYKTQLRPLILALISGGSAPVISDQPPAPSNSGLQQLTDTVGNWSARAEVVAQPALLQNLTASWQAGLTKLSFTTEEMPLDAGKLNFGWDGKNQNVPESASWYAETPRQICTLNLTLNPDATLILANGNCRPKE